MFDLSWIMVAFYMAQRQIPVYDNWVASTTLDYNWQAGRSAPAQSPVCTQRPTKLICMIVGWRCPCFTICELFPASTMWYTMLCMDLTDRLEIYLSLGQIGEEYATFEPPHWSKGRGNHGLCRHQCRFGLSHEDTQWVMYVLAFDCRGSSITPHLNQHLRGVRQGWASRCKRRREHCEPTTTNRMKGENQKCVRT